MHCSFEHKRVTDKVTGQLIVDRTSQEREEQDDEGVQIEELRTK